MFQNDTGFHIIVYFQLAIQGHIEALFINDDSPIIQNEENEGKYVSKSDGHRCSFNISHIPSKVPLLLTMFISD